MQYNTQNPKLIIPEYGRNVHTMIRYCKTLPTKEERNRFIESVIDIMGSISPHLRDVADFKHKLWDQLFIMAEFDLDVDSPYPKPNEEEIFKKPQRLDYNKELKTYRYYGKIIKDLIGIIKDWEESDKKQAATLSIVNQMKKSYINWNKDEVNNSVILNDLHKLSGGKMKLDNPEEIIHNVVKLNPKNPNKRKKKSKNQKRN